MEAWSDKPLEPFKVKFFLDTNILCDLVNNSFDGVSETISWLDNCVFADLVSSNYVIFEFLDVRKKMLYQEEVNRIKVNELRSKSWLRYFFYNLFEGKKSADPNYLVKHKEGYRNKEVDFHSYKQEIKDRISKDIEFLENLKINYAGNLLHDKLLSPTKDLNLSTRLSREDSIVTISSIWPDDFKKESFLVLITRDKLFVESFEEISLASFFNVHNLVAPILSHVSDIKLNSGTKVNLVDSNDSKKLLSFLPKKMMELLIFKNQNIFLGKTFLPKGKNFPSDAMCFKLIAKASLNKNSYLTIIGKNLDFIYSLKYPIQEFYNNSTKPISIYPFTNTKEANISFTPKDNSTGNLLSLDAEIIKKLREDGNLVFVNPDSIE